MEGFDSGGSIGKAPQFGENSTGSVRFHLLSFCRFFFFWLCSYYNSGVFFFPWNFVMQKIQYLMHRNMHFLVKM